MTRWPLRKIALTCLGLISLISFIAHSSSYAANCSNPEGIEGAIVFNSSQHVLQYCTGSNWQGYGAISVGPTGCPTIGDICSDGSVYAGLSPDGNVPMYTTPADAGVYPWNNGNSAGHTTTSQTSWITGKANMTNLTGMDSDDGTGGMQPHQAAQTCTDLADHGHTDWYLPAMDELNILYTNKNTGDLNGTFNETGSFPAGWYWSSSESNIDNGRNQKFSDGLQANSIKHFTAPR